MISQVRTSAVIGLTGIPVKVETGLFNQIPGVYITGLASKTIVESRDRIKSAIRQAGEKYPDKKIVINLVPASVSKEGSHFDLPMALGIMVAGGSLNPEKIKDIGFIGELSLDGTIYPVKGVLPLVKGMRDGGALCAVIPSENLEEASMVPQIKLKGADSLEELLVWLNKENKSYEEGTKGEILKEKFEEDFSQVKGQEEAKRSILLGVAGGHHLFMMGFPGSGKTMLARRIPSIMPPLEKEEELEVTTIYSVSGELKPGRIFYKNRPFRSPHHTITKAALIGGGPLAGPGEISLAHRGVLFLDEFPEFSREILELLRQPLETGEITIARNKRRVTYPCKILLVAAGNPCSCGYYGDPLHNCTCSPLDIRRYQSRLSGPLVDRMDLQIQVASVPKELILNLKKPENIHKGMSSEEMRNKVAKVREIQKDRYGPLILNGQIGPDMIEKYCKLTSKAQVFIGLALEKLGLSMRGYHKLLKLARTIADLEEKEQIGEEELLEAVRYRTLERMYLK